MKAYEIFENAIIERIKTVFNEEIKEGLIKAGDSDSVLDKVFSDGEKYGCFIEYNGGREDTRRETFNRPVWVWSIAGVFIIRYSDTIEQDLRLLLAKVPLLFAPPNHTLEGLTPLVSFREIAEAQPGQINDIPFYWLPFTIEVIDN